MCCHSMSGVRLTVLQEPQGLYSTPTRGLLPMRDAMRALHEAQLYVYQAKSVATVRDPRLSVCFPLIATTRAHPAPLPTGLSGSQFVWFLFRPDSAEHKQQSDEPNNSREPGCVLVGG